MSKNFNIKPSDSQYIINEDKKVVVCVIDNTKQLFLQFARENFTPALMWDSSLEKKLYMPNRFCGIARCSNDDEWNVEIGKLIAFSRAKDKVNKSFFKRANTFINTYDQLINNAADILNKVGDKLTINTEHRHNLIESIIGPEESNGVDSE